MGVGRVARERRDRGGESRARCGGVLWAAREVSGFVLFRHLLFTWSVEGGALQGG